MDQTNFVLKELKEDLESSDTAKRKTALLCLLRLGSGPEMESILLKLSELDDDPEIRYNAKKALSELNIKQRPEFVETRNLIARLLQNTGEKRIAVYQRVFASNDSFMKLELLLQLFRDPLAKEESKALIEVLKERIQNDKDPFLIPVYVRGLGVFGDEAVVSTLQRLLASSNPRVIANAIEALEELKIDYALNMVLPLLAHEDNRVRGNAIKLVFKTDPERAVEEIRRMSTALQPWMRATAIYCIRSLRFAEREEILSFMWMNEVDAEIRETLLAAFADIGGLDSIVILRESLEKFPILAERVKKTVDKIKAAHGISEALIEKQTQKIQTEKQALAEKKKQETLRKAKLAENVAAKEESPVPAEGFSRRRIGMLAGVLVTILLVFRLSYEVLVVKKGYTIDALSKGPALDVEDQIILQTAEMLRSKGRYEEAIQVYDRFILRVPNRFGAQYSRVLALLAVNQTEKARKGLEAILLSITNQAEPYYIMACLDWFDGKSISKAKEMARKAENLNPSSSQILRLLYDLAREEGDKAGMKAILEKAKSLSGFAAMVEKPMTRKEALLR